MKRLFILLLLATPVMGVDFNDPRAVADAAVASHPSITRLSAEAGAARERVRPAQALPNPMVMAGIQNKMIDLSDDEMMTMYMVGASQTITRPSKRAGRGELASLRAEALERQIESVRAEVERDALLAWYDLAAADAALRTTADVREMIDAIIAAARVRYEVGTSAQADVIRAQLQLSNLDHEILRLQASRRSAVARLLPLLGLPPGTEVPPVAMPEGTEDLTIGASSLPPADHPAIRALQAEVEASELEVRLAKLDLRPDVDIEAQYGYRRTQRDMFSVVARFELPLRRDETVEPRVREATLRREAALARIEELRRSLVGALGAATVAHDEATTQMRLHDEVLVPQARLAFESTLAAYQTGKASFDSILTTETEFLRLRVQYYEFLARHAQAVVNYEAIQKGARASALGASSPGGLASPGTGSSSSAMSTM